MYSARGSLKEDLKDYTGALVDHTKSIELDGLESNYYVFRGRTKHSLGDYKGAIVDLSSALHLDANSAEAYYYRGLALITTKQNGCIDLNKSLELRFIKATSVVDKFCK